MNGRTKSSRVGLLLLLLLAVSGIASAAGPFSIDRWTVDGGGGVSQAGTYTLTGTLGQPDAGVMKGSSYLLPGGFWRGEAVAPDRYTLNLPLVVR